MNAGASRADEVLGRVQRITRLLLTPDGVPLRVEVANLGERAAAFTIDFFITILAADAFLLLALLISGGRLGGNTAAALTFAAFVVRNAYFVGFEIARGGVTPGKRAFGLRVVDRHGGPLGAGAVVARNLSREAEIFFPLGMVIAGESWVTAPWEIVPVALWLALTSVFPLCNRDRLRAGDLLAGTIVITVPKKVLLDELVAERVSYAFTDEQLQRYGILELQVLEDVLRRSTGTGNAGLLEDVAERIRRKIGWADPVEPYRVRTFLGDFYAAQRAFLELRKHLGEEREDKFYRAAPKR
jgi:uncharacterized RDD family membrane protein YckC